MLFNENQAVSFTNNSRFFASSGGQETEIQSHEGLFIYHARMQYTSLSEDMIIDLCSFVRSPYHRTNNMDQYVLNTQKTKVYTLQGTNISPKNGILKMIFLFPRWDMLVPWRVIHVST